jgi:hypothetical protein
MIPYRWMRVRNPGDRCTQPIGGDDHSHEIPPEQLLHIAMTRQ